MAEAADDTTAGGRAARRWLVAFGRFWWEFLIGDTPELFVGGVAVIGVLALLCLRPGLRTWPPTWPPCWSTAVLTASVAPGGPGGAPALTGPSVRRPQMGWPTGRTMTSLTSTPAGWPTIHPTASATASGSRAKAGAPWAPQNGVSVMPGSTSATRMPASVSWGRRFWGEAATAALVAP